MIHPDSFLRFVHEEVGYGVFANHDLPKGTLLWVRDDLDISTSPGELAKMPAIYRALIEKYCFIDEFGQHVLCWDNGRSMNHSCDPAGRGYKQRFEIARRDIAAGEELTCEYAGLNITRGFACACGSPECRKEISPKDFLSFEESWLNEANHLISLIPLVPQPLWPFALSKTDDPAVLAAMKDVLPLSIPFVGEVGTGCWSLR
ncbi:MAG TPA: SET domain-containing protein-lysine N-methyltransferase [Cyanobacteria bacterium UBA8530]|nr:SET domain-containing protein-lysine N-methyltransferase [Cyanobacteria bacterium UBA8530]